MLPDAETRRRVRVRTETTGESKFATQYAAVRLAHMLSRLGYSVSVDIIGGDEAERAAEAQRRRNAMRARSSSPTK
jgi:hypothetical protein